MAITVDLDMATAISAAVGTLTLGTNLFAGPVRAQVGGVPYDSTVFVLATGGSSPQPYLDGSGTDYNISSVQVTVRSATDTFAAGQALARTVRAALHQQAVAGYIDVTAVSTEPSYLGQDKDGQHRWTSNFDLQHVR